MDKQVIPITKKKRIALIAHDKKKDDLLDWALKNKEKLSNHELFATKPQVHCWLKI